MLRAYLTVSDELKSIDNLTEKGIWINLINPTEVELKKVSIAAGINCDLLRAALDAEERSRIEVEDEQLLILINVPISEGENGSLYYDAVPLGIIVSEHSVVTVCLKENPVVTEFEYGKNRSFYTFKKTRFVLQMLFKTATYFLRYLQQIDKKSGEIENKLHGSMKNEELIRLLNLQKSLVYFTTSLRANEVVMEKLLRLQLKTPMTNMDPETEMTTHILKMYPEDEELLEDVITENKQAIEMCQTYSNILTGTMDAFASIISNNLNIVMKFLTSVTIVMALPTMVASFYGMNVAVPMQHSPYAFVFTIALSIILTLVGVVLLRRKNMF
jgi:magnesium transporter